MNSANARVIGLALLVLATLQGCAGFDEYKCGGRFYTYRDGMCVGFGAGFQHHVVTPAEARKRYPQGSL